MANPRIDIDLGVNAENVKIVIDKINNQLITLKNTLATLPEGSKDFGKITKEFTSLNTQVDRLSKSINKVSTTTTKDSFQGLSDSTKDARNALTSLSLVAQDLPFGFIGIQNNLPRVIQTLGDLSKSSQKSSIDLKQLIPSALFLGFSAITAAVTVAVQNFGSLSNAIDALFGKKIDPLLQRASESFKKFNEELLTVKEYSTQASSSQDGLAIKLQVLSGIVLDLTKSETERKNALDQLQKLDKQRFANFDIEKGKLEGLKQAVDQYTQSLIAQAVAKKFEDKVADASISLNQQRDAFDKLIVSQKNYENTFPGVEQELVNFNKRVEETNDLIKRNLIEPGTIILPTERVSEYQKILKQVAEAQNRVGESFKIYEEISKTFQDAIVNANQYYQITTSGEQKTTKALKEKIEVLRTVLERPAVILPDLNKRLREGLKGLEEFRRKNNEINTNLKPATFLPGPAIIAEQKRIDEILKKFFEARTILQNTFFNPLTDLFQNFFETGQFAFKKFGDAVLKEIQRVVARIIASKIITLLANILTPGAGTILSAAKSYNPDLLKGIPDIFKLTRPRGPGEANFGGLQGGLGLTGQVVFRQSGSDLVGVLNRTNATINRVG